MATLASFLSGKKTYLCALLVAFAAAAKYLGYLDDTQSELLLGLFGAGGLAALRAAK